MDDKQIVGQPTSRITRQVTKVDLDIAKRLSEGAVLASTNGVRYFDNIIATLDDRSEEESFRKGKEIL